MRRGNYIAAVLLLGIVGCAGSSNGPKTTAKQPINPEERTYTQHAASALAFTPPIAANLPPIDLTRDGRAPEAFWGFEQGYTTTYDLYIDDRQSSGSHDRYLREATSDKVGVILR
jgi:hypothetical protein